MAGKTKPNSIGRIMKPTDDEEDDDLTGGAVLMGRSIIDFV